MRGKPPESFLVNYAHCSLLSSHDFYLDDTVVKTISLCSLTHLLWLFIIRSTNTALTNEHPPDPCIKNPRQALTITFSITTRKSKPSHGVRLLIFLCVWQLLNQKIEAHSSPLASNLIPNVEKERSLSIIIVN